MNNTKSKMLDEKMPEEKGKKGGAATSSTATSIMGAAMVGAIAGAAVGIATSMALSDEKTRQKATEFVGNMRDKAADRIEEMTKGAQKTSNQAMKTIKEGATETVKKTMQGKSADKKNNEE